MARAKIWNGTTWIPATDGGVIPASGQIVAGTVGGTTLLLGSGQYPKGDGTNVVAGDFVTDVGNASPVVSNAAAIAAHAALITALTPQSTGSLVSRAADGTTVQLPTGVPGQFPGASSTGELKFITLIVLHVDFWPGVTANGLADCATGINAAITVGKAMGNSSNLAQGCLLVFGVGAYSVRSPIILPRNGSSPNFTVQLMGANLRATVIIGHSTLFPANRAVIEWEATANRIWHGRIANMRIHAPNIAGTACIRHTPVNPLDTYAHVSGEWMQCDFENLLLTGSNDYHQAMIDLGVGNRFARMVNIFGDPSPGTASTYDTVLIKTPTDYTGGGVGLNDVMGIGFCQVSNLFQDIRVGGFGAVFSGRAYGGHWDNMFANGGHAGSYAYSFTNSFGGTYDQLACEGRSDTAQIRLNNCVGMHLFQPGLGTPNPAYAGWAAGTVYGVGATVVQPNLITGASPTSNMVLQATNAGISGATLPSPWPTVVGGTVTDNGITWQAVAAGTGTGIKLENGTRGCIIDMRLAANGNPKFSAYLATLIDIDSTSQLNIFRNIDVRANGDGNPSAEFHITAAPGKLNLISGTDLGAGSLAVPYAIGWHPHHHIDRKARTITTSATLNAEDRLILVDATAGVVTLTPPSAAGLGGKQYVVKLIAGAANGWVFDPAGAETVDTAATLSNTTLNQAVWLESDNVNWRITS